MRLTAKSSLDVYKSTSDQVRVTDHPIGLVSLTLEPVAMKVSVLAALIGITPRLVAAGPADALQPASLCYTYHTTYLATVSVPSVTGVDGWGGSDGLPPGSGRKSHPSASAHRHLSLAGVDPSRQIQHPHQTEAYDSGNTLSSKAAHGHPPTGIPRPHNTRPTRVASSVQPSGTAVAETVIFSIVPQGQNDRRGLEKRDSGGFLNLAEDGIKASCSEASTFGLVDRELIVNGYPIWATSSWTFTLFKGLGEPGSLGAPEANVITRTFEVDADSYLHWVNSAFSGGEAYFCQLVSSDHSGQVYIVFSPHQSDWPEHCQSVKLKTFEGKRSISGLRRRGLTRFPCLPTLLCSLSFAGTNMRLCRQSLG